MVVHTDDELLTVEEVAQLLKVPTSWVYERCRGCALDPLPHIKLGEYLRFCPKRTDQLPRKASTRVPFLGSLAIRAIAVLVLFLWKKSGSGPCPVDQSRPE